MSLMAALAAEVDRIMRRDAAHAKHHLLNLLPDWVPLESQCAVAGRFPLLPPTPKPLGYVLPPPGSRKVERKEQTGFDYTGIRYGRLVVIGRAREAGHRHWTMRCDCGKTKARQIDDVLRAMRNGVVSPSCAACAQKTRRRA